MERPPLREVVASGPSQRPPVMIHIKWHAAGGPDAVPNGLAPCGFHDKAFDGSALGLTAAAGGDHVILISSEGNGLSASVGWLLDSRAKPPALSPEPGLHARLGIRRLGCVPKSCAGCTRRERWGDVGRG